MRSKKIKIWLIIGIVLRLILMLVGFHDDLRAIVFGGYLAVIQGRLFSFYDYLPNLSPANRLLSAFEPYLFIYPPLAYIIPGIFLFLLSPLINFDFLMDYVLTPRNYLGSWPLMRHLFLFKVPYLVFDMAAGYFLSRLFKKENQQKALIFWLLNPISLYAGFTMGQLEIFPIFFVILAVYLALKQDKRGLAAAALGIGGAFKLFPLLLIPIFGFVLGSKIWPRLKLILIGFGIYGLIILPYFLLSPGYRRSALLAGQADKMFYMQLPVTAAEGLPIFSLIYFLIVLMAYYQKGVFAKPKTGIWAGGFGVLGLFYSLTHYHPQWFLWFTPFLIWVWLKYREKARLAIILILLSFFVHLIFFDYSLHLGLFSGAFAQLQDLGRLEHLLSFPAAFWRNSFRALSTASIIYLYSLIYWQAKTKD